MDFFFTCLRPLGKICLLILVEILISHFLQSFSVFAHLLCCSWLSNIIWAAQYIPIYGDDGIMSSRNVRIPWRIKM